MTAAATVMVAVFSIFATLSLVDLKQLGIGLAAAVLIDATLIRGIVLPASMKLLGKWNWWMPRSLNWLPSLGEAPARRGPLDERPEPTPPARPEGPPPGGPSACRGSAQLGLDVGDAAAARAPALAHGAPGEALQRGVERGLDAV